MSRVVGRLVATCMFVVILGAVPADALQSIVLQDGTILQGEVLHFDGSTYSIRTRSLGDVKIERSKVRGIHMSGSDQEGAQDIRTRLLADPEALRMIMGLQNDPDVQAVLSDPGIMSAAEAGDLEKLLSNPKIIKLLQNPIIQEIGKGLSR